MSDSASSALHRMLAPGQGPRPDLTCDPEYIARKAVTDTFARLFGLTALVTSAVVEAASYDSALQEAHADHLTFALQGADRALGLALLDRAMVASLIEGQTMGRVGSHAPDERPYTATDAALCEACIERVVAGLAPLSAIGWNCALRLDRRIEDQRRVPLMLPDHRYHRMTVKVDIDNGNREGELVLIVPHLFVDKTGMNDASGQGWQRALEAAVMPSRTVLEAELARISRSFAEIADFKVGDTIFLPAEALTQVAVLGAGGLPLASGKLGQMGGKRAVRLDAGFSGTSAQAALQQAKGPKPPFAGAEPANLQPPVARPAMPTPDRPAPGAAGSEVMPQGAEPALPASGAAVPDEVPTLEGAS